MLNEDMRGCQSGHPLCYINGIIIIIFDDTDLKISFQGYTGIINLQYYLKVLYMRTVIISIFFIFSFIKVFSQSVIAPNFALKSHETLEILKIESTVKTTVFFMSVENRIEGGSFCADRNVFMVRPDGSRIRLLSAEGIPVCPDAHKFRIPGEKLSFTLAFPALEKGVESIDLIEDCSDNCFSFYGVITNDVLNRSINDAYSYAENEEPLKALVSFQDLTRMTGNNRTGAEGLLYMNIVRLSAETGNDSLAREYYMKLKEKDIREGDRYIKYLNSQGIRY